MKALLFILPLTLVVSATQSHAEQKPVLVKPKHMHYSEALINGIKQFENMKLSKQKDSYIDKRRWDKYGKCHEIGYGFTDNLVDAGIRFHKLPKGYKLPKTMTKKQADKFLINKAIPICHALVRHYTKANMTLRQRDALIMFTYNFRRLLNLIGIDLFKKLCLAIKNNNLTQIRQEIVAYI